MNQRPAPAPEDPESAMGTKSPSTLAALPTMRVDDPVGAHQCGLSPEEIEQFRRDGYLIKRDLVPGELFRPILDLWWQQPPVTESGVIREQPETWVSPGDRWLSENRRGLTYNWMGENLWPGPEDARPGATVGDRVGRLPYKLTRDRTNDVWRWHGIEHDPEFVACTTGHPNVMYMAEALLGGPIKKPHRNRGLYAVFPCDPEGPESILGPHIDQNMTELMVVTYLHDVEPGGGGFTFWPGSPQMLYPTSQQAFNWVATGASHEAMDKAKTEIQPLEFTGKAGDTLFCHALMIHSAGIHQGQGIRFACIQDMNKSRPRTHMRWTVAGKHGGPRVHCDMDGIIRIDRETGDDPADGNREVTNQWIMDSNEFVVSREPPHVDMFDEWNLGKAAVSGNIVDEQPWWERYDLPMMPGEGMGRGTGGVPAVALKDIADYEGNGIWCVRRRGIEELD